MTVYAATMERRLSDTELAVFCADSVGSMNFAMHVELRGFLAEPQLRAALDAAQARHPLLRVRVVEEGRELWFRSVGDVLPLRVVDAPPEALTAEAEREVRTVFDPAVGPLARCVFIRHAREHATLLVTFHHVIGDGISGTYLVRDILRALSGEALAPLPLAESLDGHLPARARGAAGFFGYLRMLALIAGWVLRRGIPRGVPSEVLAGHGARRANLLLERFEPAFTRALAARARREGTSVHGALAAAIALGSFPAMGRRRAHCVFGSPLNMRDKFEPPIGEDIGFYVAIAASSHVLDAGTDFWTLAREMKQGLQRGLALDMPFFGLTGAAPVLRVLYRLAGGGPPPGGSPRF
jgi:hypothetical protein